MANSKNLGVFFVLVLFNLVHSNANIAPSNNVASTICPKTRNVSLCWNVLEHASNTSLTLNLANYTLNLARTSVVECLSYAQGLEAAEATNSQLKKRYSKCSRELEFVVQGIEEGEYCLDIASSFLLVETVTSIENHVDGCLETFKQLPSEPSKLLEKAKNLGDICNILVWVSTTLDGSDDYYKSVET